jgi:hypothetical protein
MWQLRLETVCSLLQAILTLVMATDKVQLHLGNLNNSAIRLLTKAVEENATTDLMPVLEKLVRTYASVRNNIAKGDLKKHRKGESLK